MSESSDDLSKYVIKTEITPDKVQKIAAGLAAGESGGGTIFSPMEAVAAGIRAGNALAEFLKVGAMMAARGIIMPVELVLRHGFGERYFNGFVVGSFLFIYAIARYGTGVYARCCHRLLFWTVVLLLVHNAIRFWRDRKGDYRHSYSEGESWLRIPPLDQFLARWNFTFDATKIVIEPLVVYGFSLIAHVTPTQRIEGLFAVHRFNPDVIYFQTAAVVLFVYQLCCYLYRGNQFLDEKDNQVIAEVRAKFENHSETEGFHAYKGVSYTILGGKHIINKRL